MCVCEGVCMYVVLCVCVLCMCVVFVFGVCCVCVLCLCFGVCVSVCLSVCLRSLLPDLSNLPLHTTEWCVLHGMINPFTVPSYKISGLNDAGTRLQTVQFPVL